MNKRELYLYVIFDHKIILLGYMKRETIKRSVYCFHMFMNVVESKYVLKSYKGKSVRTGCLFQS